MLQPPALVEFAIFGPFEARSGEEAITLGGPKQRALLAALLLDAGRVVFLDRLVDMLRLGPARRNCSGSARSGQNSPVPAGDLGTGANHCLPTGGWARSVGGLGLETFLTPITVQRLTPEGLARVRPTVEALAAVEGLPAHAAAMAR